MRRTLLLLALGAVSGCQNMHESYAASARRECMKEVSDVDRRACLERVEDAAQRLSREARPYPEDGAD